MQGRPLLHKGFGRDEDIAALHSIPKSAEHPNGHCISHAQSGQSLQSVRRMGRAAAAVQKAQPVVAVNLVNRASPQKPGELFCQEMGGVFAAREFFPAVHIEQHRCFRQPELPTGVAAGDMLSGGEDGGGGVFRIFPHGSSS